MSPPCFSLIPWAALANGVPNAEGWEIGGRGSNTPRQLLLRCQRFGMLDPLATDMKALSVTYA